jgi:hypothetical protein
MKKINLLSACILLALAFSISCNKPSENPVPEIPDAVLEPVLFNFTGTWNGTCGQILKPALDSIRQFYPGTILINAHINGAGGTGTDPLSNSDSEGLARFFNVYPSIDSTYSIPYTWFMVDGFIAGFNYIGVNYAAFATSVDWAKEMKTPAIALDIIPEISGNQLNITVRTETVYMFTMPVYISVYLTEDNVYAAQTNDAGSEPGVHHDVLRDCLNAFNGDEIANKLAAGTKGEFNYSSLLDESWNPDNMKVNVTIWYKDSIYGNLVHLGKKVNLVSK